MRFTDAIRNFAVAAVTILFGTIPVSAQEILKIEDQGSVRSFTLVEDEVLILGDTENGARLKDDVQAALPGATVLETNGSEALTKLPERVDRRKAAARQAPMQVNAPQYRSQPVLYSEGLPRTLGNRRYVGPRVLVALPAGKTVDQLRAESGALKAEVSKLPGHALLTFGDGWQSLAASEALKAQGLNARPLLRSHAEKMWVPDDPFLNDQWHVRNRGQFGGLVGADANLNQAWDLTRADLQPVRGQGVTVVVVDDSLETTHPDLSPNTPPVSSGAHEDYRTGNANDHDPKPDVGSNDAHGTSVAGVIAAKGNNKEGGTGAAPDAQLLGVRLIGGGFDAQTAYDALTWQPNGFVSSVSNNSWGWSSVGMRGLDPLERQALSDAATTGRGGLGQVTLFAAANNDDYFNGFDSRGNPLFTFQDANYQAFANSRFVIGVAACSNYGDHSYYSNRGASVLISAPSNGGSLGIFTTDNVGGSGYNSQIDPGGQPQNQNYTNSFGGTSSATPLTAGVVALMLSANGNLGYRDVMEILATTAVKIDPFHPDWIENGGGFHFANPYGAGMVNAAAAVARSLQWSNLPPVTSHSRTATGLPASIPDNSATTVSRSFDYATSPNLRVEHVEVVLAATHGNRSDLEIAITSPSGTRSILNPIRPRPNVLYTGDDDRNIGAPGNGWVFMTTHHWGENSSGTWTVTARDGQSGSTGTLDALQVRVYGTPANNQRVRFTQRVITVEEDAGTVEMDIRRIGPTTGTVTVGYAVVGGNATAGQDYTFANGTVTFNPGETQKTITATIIDDLVPEAVESLYVALTNPTGATLGGGSLCSIVIEPSDGNFVTITALGDAEASESPGLPATQETASFRVSRLIADATPLVVPYTVSGTATNSVDYLTLSLSVTIPAGLESAPINVKLLIDNLFEGPETVTVKLTDPGVSGDYQLGDPNEATITIKDDEIQEANVETSSNSLPENGSSSATITVSRLLSGGTTTPADPLTVNLFIGGSAQPGVDYEVLPDSVTIPGGEMLATLKLQPKDNDVYNPNRTVLVAIAPKSDYRQGSRKEFVVQIINDEAAPDLKKPSVAIATPLANQRFNAPVPTLTATGTARDNLGVESVQFRVNAGDWLAATMPTPTSWSAELTTQIRPGPNVLEVRAKDEDGNFSPVVFRPFTIVQPRNLQVLQVGDGTVTPGSGTYEAGQIYTLRARPLAGKIFKGWTGDLTGSSKVLTFTMPDADTTVTATFMDNPFAAAVIGRYAGLVNGTTSLPETSGMIDIVVSKTGAFTGKLWYGGTAFTLKGEFSGAGEFEGSIKRKKRVPLSVRLTLDVNDPGTLSITGVVDGDVQPSNVYARRAGYDKTHAVPAALAHAFTFYIPPKFPADSSKPHGNGVGTVSITTAGIVKWTGYLGDGTPATQTTVLDGQNQWPLYVPLYKGTGYASGQVAHDAAQAGSDLSATLNWVKVPAPKDKFFRDGFTIDGSAFIGVGYTPPNAGTRVLTGYGSAPGNSGPIHLVDGNLLPPIVKQLALGTNNSATISGPNTEKLKISIAAKTGVVKGSFFFPIPKKLTQIKGVILQNKIGKGVGLFSGSSLSSPLQTGRVEFFPAP